MFDFVNDSVHPQEVLTPDSIIDPLMFLLAGQHFHFSCEIFQHRLERLPPPSQLHPLRAAAKNSGSVLTCNQTEVHSVSFYFSADRKIEKQKIKTKTEKNQLQNIHTAEV